MKLVMKKLIVTLLSPRRIRQGKKWKQGSTNLNPVRVFWNSRCAILHLISNPPSPLTTNKKKNHRAYQKCYMTMCWGIKWSSDGNKCDGHPEKMTWRLPKLEWSSTMLYVWKGAHTHTVANMLYSYKRGFESVLINVTGCDQGQSCDASAGPL